MPVSLTIRALLGLFLGLIFGVMGFFVGGMLWYPALGHGYYIALPILSAGAGAGFGAFVGWLRPERSRSMICMTLGITILGGLLGAWAGYGYARMTYEPVVLPGLEPDKMKLLLPHAARAGSIFGGTVGGSVFPVVTEIIVRLRRGVGEQGRDPPCQDRWRT